MRIARANPAPGRVSELAGLSPAWLNECLVRTANSPRLKLLNCIKCKATQAAVAKLSRISIRNRERALYPGSEPNERAAAGHVSEEGEAGACKTIWRESTRREDNCVRGEHMANEAGANPKVRAPGFSFLGGFQ
jgi:hypothetical protein